MRKLAIRATGAALASLAALSALGCGPGGSGERASLTVAVRTDRWNFGDAAGQVLATRHYRIHTTSPNQWLLGTLPGFLESARDNYLRLTGLEEGAGPAAPAATYVLATRDQWAAMTERVTGASSPRYLAIERGGYCHRGVCVLWDLGGLATFVIAAHEGCHQFLHHRLRDPLPAWAEEGLCVLAEGFYLGVRTVRFSPERNTLRQADLRRLIVGRRWLGTAKLLAGDAADRTGPRRADSAEYYAQLWALLLFVRSDPDYRAGLARLTADAAAGRLRAALAVPPEMGVGRTYVRAIGTPAFRRYVEADLAAFERRLLPFAKRLAKLE